MKMGFGISSFAFKKNKLVNFRTGILLVAAFMVCINTGYHIPKSGASTGLIVTSGASGTGINAWGSPANAYGTGDNNTYATANPANNASINGIWNTYGFDSSLPLHAVITKVELIAQWKVDSTLSTVSLSTFTTVNGTDCPTVSHGAEPTTDTNFTADFTSCRAWTRADLLNSSFATKIGANRFNSAVVGATFTLDYVQVRVTYSTPDYTQAGYRWFDNADRTTPASTLAAENTPTTLYAPADRVRLRMLLHVGTANLIASSEQFKLQFASKGASCTTASYADVTNSSLIAYFNNPTPVSGESTSTTENDPSHSGHTAIAQSYVESSPISTLVATATNQDALWDMSLVGNGAPANTTYCFRMVTNSGTALSAYSIYPELTTAPTGGISADIVDNTASSVPSPSFSFSSAVAPYTCTTTTSTIGTSLQKIRAKNTSSTPGWTLSIAATGGSSSLWSAGTPKYDFNDGAGSPAGCASGLDGDTYAGRMTIDASAGNLTPRSVSACTTTGISKGSSASFSEGSINSISLLNASSSANVGCFWDFTGINASQSIPAGQSAGNYSLSLTLTIVAN